MNGVITAGHTVDKNGFGTGAYGIIENKKRFDEAVEARKLVNSILYELKRTHGLEFLTEDDAWNLSQVINFIKLKVTKPLLSLDFHFNASTNENAKGSEVFVPNEPSQLEKEFAKIIVSTICKTLSTNMRIGDKEFFYKRASESQHTRLGILEDPKAATNILIEICFITNEEDVKKYRENYNKLVVNLATEIAVFTKTKT